MKIKATKGERIYGVINAIIMIFLIVATLYPMLYILFASFSDAESIIKNNGLLLAPIGFNIDAYKYAFENPMLLRSYINTIIVVVIGVSFNLILTSLGAYVLSRQHVFWNKFIMMFIVFTMFFSGGLVPFYLTIKDLHLDNTLWALIFPSAINTFNLIIMRTAFAAVPKSLEESAKIDGANHFVIMLKIVLPLSTAVIGVITLYYAVAHWNSWFNAMIFLRDRELFPLQLMLREILIENRTDDMLTSVSDGDMFQISETVKYAIIIITTLPILFIYPFVQKYFVKGVMVGAVKE